jgi:hypothetical protein
LVCHDLVWEKSKTCGYLDAKITIKNPRNEIYFGNMEAQYLEDVNIKGYFKFIFDYINSLRPEKEMRELFGQRNINHCWRFATIRFAFANRNVLKISEKKKRNQKKNTTPDDGRKTLQIKRR